MKQKTSGNNKLDSKSFGSRAMELTSICLFTIIAALVSTLLMDIIVFPLTLFAVNDVPSFNLLIEILFIALVGSTVLYKLVSRARSLKKEGMELKYIIIYMIKRPVHYIGLFLIILTLCGVLIAAIYILFNLNFYYIHRLAGGA